MFERQSRPAFPTISILVLAMVVVAFLVYLLKSVQWVVPAPAPPDATMPATDSGRIEVHIDSLVR